jgi:hypothetical protein
MKPKRHNPFRIIGVHLAAAFVAIATTAVAGSVDALKSHPNSKFWPNLFAADLSDAVYPTNVWSWSGGELSPKDKDEVIWTKQDYENFVLDLEFKSEPDANSGVIVYCTDIKNWIPNAVEIQLLDDAGPKWTDAAPNWRCGGIFGHSAPMKSVLKKAGQWNRMTIWCRGPFITVLLNGATVTDINMQDYSSAKKNPDGSNVPRWLTRPMSEMATRGRIGLQGVHGGRATHFRNLKITACK